MKNYLYLLIIPLLISCSEYQDIKMTCRGELIKIKNNFLVIPNQLIGLRIDKDKISLSGNPYQSVDELQVCKIGTNEYSKKDTLYFSSWSCEKKGEIGIGTTKYGTYNFLTKELNFTESSGYLNSISGKYSCEKS
jgi:hypothetical protein